MKFSGTQQVYVNGCECTRPDVNIRLHDLLFIFCAVAAVEYCAEDA